ncbi:choline-binding protein LytC, 4-beta-N-acetylmuramidase, Cpb13 [Streptococcus mitis]|uniref:Choline-binding protein LytC, 4-beta-N-acetylmuramidase, Cpb13 n=1 Tax=Streptococcus mitis TaxID=28037 RepID=A0A4U9XR54_STRMT|nr:choline-binding protein LytC, 4-beta-N-acetylmuramidase, Cpb13 [Streptococcus mitis]
MSLQNETEVKSSSEGSRVQDSSSKVEEKKSETTTSQKEEEKMEEVKETRASSSQKEESKPNLTSAHWEGDFYVKADGSKAKSEWIFDTSYSSWFYIKSDGRYAQKEWHGKTITSKWVVTWLKMNGFTITIIIAGSTSR